MALQNTGPTASYERDAQYVDRYGAPRSQINVLGVPAPTFGKIGTTGALPENFRIDPNTQGLEAIRSAALGPGPSSFAEQLISQQNARTSGALGNLGQQSAGALTNTKNALSATSGLSGAQSDKLQQANDRQTLFARQGIQNQNNVAAEAILGQDASLKQGFLNALPALNQQAQGAQKFNIQNAIQDKALEDQFNLGIQDVTQKAIAAQFQSDATRNSGSNGIFGDLFSGLGF